MHWKKIVTAALVLISLSGCSWANKLVYRIDINQGNYIDQNAVEELKFGMTKEQVKFLLGSPMLVESGYPKTWYFVQYVKPGHEESEQKELILSFDNNSLLIGMKGDYQPSSGFFEVVQ
ncbi:outer membrane protein assembly factor BamE [Grimontia hollisae]|uniref:Outer membrane protein assembly factor BamE n=2 Tax=Grimontia hollisae TaxID=673 RepID=D0ICT6_GRIHO|nr:outer membrane protein assembly factor BamE [Grimontia hollisae]AMG30065.1 outer membrane protein assembly factor BamE [Grimontia hollisae]EEY71704.1 lipoprotein SmpA a component of the essential YaeT outer-membrane protein assembly complex [Grimontia hollisae CIP 101886]MDF2184280.1 outer membrane protein assembly factor BamE [Grimontia hollisae]STO42744.1 Small protein A precursor [Grimontia hollisae]STO56579.1 Small protein A precursor [Grimontia hollisae]